MLAVMAAAMLAHSALVSLVGAVALLIVSALCAALSRARPFLRAHILDLWAMALALLALLPRARGGDGHHAVVVQTEGPVVIAAVIIGWMCLRAVLARRRVPRRPELVSSAVTAAGLTSMALMGGLHA